MQPLKSISVLCFCQQQVPSFSSPTHPQRVAHMSNDHSMKTWNPFAFQPGSLCGSFRQQLYLWDWVARVSLLLHFCRCLLLLKPHTPFHKEKILQILSCYVTSADLFLWVLQSFLIFYIPSLSFFLANWPVLNKSVFQIKKKKKERKKQSTSSNFLIIKKHNHIFSLHCTHIQNLDSGRGVPAKLGRSGEEGWLGICSPAGVFAGWDANCRPNKL